MERLISGAIIRQLRKAKNMTQEELADEICSERTIRKIENGEHSTKQIIFEHLLEKLGEDINKYFFYSQNISDNKIFDSITEIRDLIQKRNFFTAREKYNLLYCNKSFASAINDKYNPAGKIYKQYSLHWEALFLHNIDGKSKEALEKEYRAIHETIKDPALNNIEDRILFEREYLILNAIALLHFSIGEVDKCIDILTKLKISLNKPSVSKQFRLKTIPFICCNLSKFLGLQERYAEANLVCDEGIDACEDAQSSRNLGYLYYNKAVENYHLGNKDCINAQKYFLKAYYTFLSVKDYEMVKIVKRNALEEYGISL